MQLSAIQTELTKIDISKAMEKFIGHSLGEESD